MGSAPNLALDMKINIPTAILIGVQLVGVLWYVFGLRADIDTNRLEISRLMQTATVIASAGHGQAVQLGRIEEQINAVRSDVMRMIAKLD